MARKLTKNERNLLFLFSVAIFAVLNLFGVSNLFGKLGQFQTKLVSLRNERRDARSWLADKDMWLQREQWLNKTQPKLQNNGEANAVLLEALQTSARNHSITIVEQGFVEPGKQTDYQEIAVKLKISGSLEEIARWLVEIQQPANFQAVPSLSMKTDTDATKILCELTVARWYAPK